MLNSTQGSHDSEDNTPKAHASIFDRSVAVSGSERVAGVTPKPNIGYSITDEDAFYSYLNSLGVKDDEIAAMRRKAESLKSH